MKTKKILASVLAIAMLACMFIMPANAAEAEADEHIEIIIENQNLSEEAKEKIIAYYTNGGEEQGAATYGLTCTLLGHDFEYTRVYKITHKVRTTSPRCLKKTYEHAICNRCDYSESTLASSIYIICC